MRHILGDKDTTKIRSALAAARATRGQALAKIARGYMSLWEFIEKSKTSRPLAKCRLKTLLKAAVGPARATWIMDRLLEASATGKQNPTVEWLYDAKSSSARLGLLAALLTAPEGMPWAGYPFADPPQKIQKVWNIYRGANSVKS